MKYTENTNKNGDFYPVWMQDGALMGARFDAAFDGTTDMTTNGLPVPALSANDSDTAANELRTHLILMSVRQQQPAQTDRGVGCPCLS